MPKTSGATLTGVRDPFPEQSSGLEWYGRWRKQQGRALRVLHLGNIANNAFNNASIQRRHGIDAYVIAYENYHIMACPEWEEATFDGDVGDPFFPDWTKVDLGGYQRPKWFASGPLDLCCAMISAELTGRAELADQMRRSLDRARQIVTSETLASRAVHFAQKTNRRIRRSPAIARDLAFDLVRRLRGVDPGTARLVAIWQKASTPTSPPTARDFARYRSRLPPLARLLEEFDIIQAYSIDGAWPLLACCPYIAYEHGTLRAIPFQDDMTGRLAATVYHGASHVFVTNIDCVAAAIKLGIPLNRITPLPHAFDDDRVVDFGKANRHVKPPSDCVSFFHPTRQDWREADPSLVKGNDRLIRAFATVSREHPHSRLTMIAWGVISMRLVS